MKKTHVSSFSLLISLLLLLINCEAQGQQQTSIIITGIKGNAGKIIVQIFRDETSYQEQIPYKKITFQKTGLTKGILNVQIQLEAGVYGFTMIDDENGNGKIDKNLIGIPKEGFGFSNFFMEKMKKPTFDDFKTDLKKHAEIIMKVKYL
ncbi:DUF2141 domain-containing protein [Pedobacter duraquae]|uniref:Uncharacterized protein (DUF2141 family) n=1 Tax=Pedobacter duraquae TaxID=425511 RepID=A0A4R6IQT2_9SPHI|nr:DUF2141 domain-containing protein [Pedobacter duraquae]TDO24557.1 uncharacterized protein (DUF2141 family) [Pedobacter duraquae]